MDKGDVCGSVSSVHVRAERSIIRINQLSIKDRQRVHSVDNVDEQTEFHITLAPKYLFDIQLQRQTGLNL